MLSRCAPTETLTMNSKNVANQIDHNKQEEETDKIDNRLRHKEVRELLQKPKNKVCHLLRHRTLNPPRIKQNIRTNSRAAEASQGQSY